MNVWVLIFLICGATVANGFDRVDADFNVTKGNFRVDGKCGSGFPGPQGGDAICNVTTPCCNSLNQCSEDTEENCKCSTCVDHRQTWRNDGKCGNKAIAPNGDPAQCNPDDLRRPCCSAEEWRPDHRCGKLFQAPAGGPAECNPNGPAPCCSDRGFCGAGPKNCTCPNCFDYRKGWRRYVQARIPGRDMGIFHQTTMENCKKLCRKNTSCNAFTWTNFSCKLKNANNRTKLLRTTALQDSMVFGLPFLAIVNTPQTIVNAPLPIVNAPDPIMSAPILAAVSAPSTSTWSSWGPCTGICGYQTHSRSCTNSGKNCKGQSVEKCIDVQQCCSYKSTRPPSKGPTVLLPFYISPRTDSAGRCVSEEWKKLARGCGAAVAVINLKNGPFASQNSQTVLRACMDYVSEHGVKLVGYVHSKATNRNNPTNEFKQTGLRDFDLVKKDVDEWYRAFGGVKGFRGIFIDEASNAHQVRTNYLNVDHVGFYQKIVKYIRTKASDALIVYNVAGTPPEEMWKKSQTFPKPIDVAVIYERDIGDWYPKDGCLNHLWTKKRGTFGPGPLCSVVVSQYVPVGDGIEPFLRAMENLQTSGATLVYGATEQEAYRSLQDVIKTKVQYHYASHREFHNNPWREMPSYWDSYMRKLSELR